MELGGEQMNWIDTWARIEVVKFYLEVGFAAVALIVGIGIVVWGELKNKKT
jgi:hypothetical protein